VRTEWARVEDGYRNRARHFGCALFFVFESTSRLCSQLRRSMPDHSASAASLSNFSER
jgi:hypothetical protein